MQRTEGFFPQISVFPSRAACACPRSAKCLRASDEQAMPRRAGHRLRRFSYVCPRMRAQKTARLRRRTSVRRRRRTLTSPPRGNAERHRRPREPSRAATPSGADALANRLAQQRRAAQAYSQIVPRGNTERRRRIFSLPDAAPASVPAARKVFCARRGLYFAPSKRGRQKPSPQFFFFVRALSSFSPVRG